MGYTAAFFILVGISAFFPNWSVPFIDILIGLALILILIKKSCMTVQDSGLFFSF